MESIGSAARCGSSWLAVAAALAALAALPAGAWAQEAASPPAQDQLENPPANADDEAIFVTGSRLRASGFTSPTPLTVLGEEQMEAIAPTRVQDILALVPSFRTTGQPASAASAGRAGTQLRAISMIGD